MWNLESQNAEIGVLHISHVRRVYSLYALAVYPLIQPSCAAFPYSQFQPATSSLTQLFTKTSQLPQQTPHPLPHPPNILAQIMHPDPLEPRIQILQRVLYAQLATRPRISQVINLATLARSADLFLGARPPELVVRLERNCNCSCAVWRRGGESVGCAGVQFREGVGEDQSVLEGLAGAGALVRAAGVGYVAEEAD